MKITIDVDDDLWRTALETALEELGSNRPPGGFSEVLVCHRTGRIPRKLIISRKRALTLTIRQERP